MLPLPAVSVFTVVALLEIKPFTKVPEIAATGDRRRPTA